MNRWSAHERPFRSVQGDISSWKAVQEQGDPWWGGLSISRWGKPARRFERRGASRGLELGLGDTNVDPGEAYPIRTCSRFWVEERHT